MSPDANMNDFEPPKQNKWWQRIPKLPLIIGVGVVLILLIAVVALSGGGNSNNKKQSSSTSVYYDRPGFPRSELSSGIGDPAALVLRKTANPITYQGTKIIQACSVFDLDDVKETGLILEPHNQPVPFKRSFFDGKGAGELQTGFYDFGLEPSYSDEGNNCQYLLNGQEAPSLTIQVVQVPYSHPAALDEELKDYHPIGQIGGLQAFQTTSGEGITLSTLTILRSGNSALRIDTNLKDAAKSQAVLERAAANFSRLLAAPDGLARVAYDSPLMPDGAVIACDILQASDIKQLFSAEANPVANEAAASAVGVIKSGDGSAQYNYIQTECTRTAARSGEPTTNIRSVTVEATTYRYENGAKDYMAYHRANDKGIVTTSPVIGNDSFFTKGPYGREDTLVVRKGSVILNFTTSAKDKRTTDLAPLAQSVTARLP